MRSALPGVFSLPCHFSYPPEVFFRAIISEMFLEKAQKSARERTRAFFYTHVRFYFAMRYLAPAPFPSSDSCPPSFSFFRILYA